MPPGTTQDLVDNVGDRVFFEFDKSTLSTSDYTTLDRQSAWLIKYPKIDILIAGNTDDRGTEVYNLALGYRRAKTVRNYLSAKGVSISRIKITSYGKLRPVYSGEDTATFKQNRNAITSVIGDNPQDWHR